MKENPIAVVHRSAVAAVAGAILSPKKNNWLRSLRICDAQRPDFFIFPGTNISASIQMIVIKLLQVTAGEKILLSKGYYVMR